MQEYEDEGISLGQIFKVIFRRWKLLLFITGIIFVFGLLGSQLVYNKLKTDYTTSVVYNVIGVNDGVYADNSQFNYRDLVKLSNLEKVKNSNNKYSSIDVKTLVEKEKISIKKEIVQDENKTSSQTVFTITASGRYFQNAEQARDFFAAVLSIPVDRTVQIIEDTNNSINLDAYSKANDYNEQVNYLKAQLAYLTSKYDSLISQFGDIYPTVNQTNTKKLSEFRLDLNSYFELHKFSELDNELTARKYVKNFNDNKSKLEIRQASLEKQIEDNEKIIDSLYDQMKRLYNPGPDEEFDIRKVQSSEVYAPYTTQISNLTVANAQMRNELSDIEKQLSEQGGDATDVAAFEAKLTTYYNQLVHETDTYTAVSKSVINENTSVDYTSKAIDSKGGLSLLISVLLFLVGGFVVAAIVNLIIDRKYLKEDTIEPAYVSNTKPLPEKTIEEPKKEEAEAKEPEETKEE